MTTINSINYSNQTKNKKKFLFLNFKWGMYYSYRAVDCSSAQERIFYPGKEFFLGAFWGKDGCVR